MTYEKPRKIVHLSDEDRADLQAAGLEIATDLSKFRQIMAERLNIPSQSPMKFRGVIVDTPGGPVILESGTLEVEWPDGRVFCYQDPPGVCCEGPCPCE